MDYFSENFIPKIIKKYYNGIYLSSIIIYDNKIVSRKIIKITLLKIEIGQFYLFVEIDIQRIAKW